MQSTRLRGGSIPLRRLSDERLAALVSRGDGAAFEALYDRHHASLLAFCRHMLGNREDGEDALQQAFLRAHRALADGRVPDAVRPWLFAIARNRCRTLLAARRDAEVPVEELEPSFDGLTDAVHRRADLRELVADLGRLPSDQREALVLFELGDLRQGEIAAAIGCPPAKVKALVFQARTALIAEREARAIPCEQIRGQLEVARAGVLRRGPLRRHLRDCEPCRAFQVSVAGQRSRLALLLPVAPSAGLKAAVLGAAGVPAGGGAAVGAAAMAGGGLAAKGLVAKVAVTVAVAGGAAGGGVAVDTALEREPAQSSATPAKVAPATPAAEPTGSTRAPAGGLVDGGSVARGAAPEGLSETAQRGPSTGLLDTALQGSGRDVQRRRAALRRRLLAGAGGARLAARLRLRAALVRRGTVPLRQLRRLAAAGAFDGVPLRRLRRLAAAGAFGEAPLRRLAAAGALDGVPLRRLAAAGAPPRFLRRLAAARTLDAVPPRLLRRPPVAGASLRRQQRLAPRLRDAAADQGDAAPPRGRRAAQLESEPTTEGGAATLEPAAAQAPPPRQRPSDRTPGPGAATPEPAAAQAPPPRRRPRDRTPGPGAVATPAPDPGVEVTPAPTATPTPQPTSTPAPADDETA